MNDAPAAPVWPGAVASNGRERSRREIAAALDKIAAFLTADADRAAGLATQFAPTLEGLRVRDSQPAPAVSTARPLLRSSRCSSTGNSARRHRNRSSMDSRALLPESSRH